MIKHAFCVSDRSAPPQAGRTPAATPPGSNANLVAPAQVAAPHACNGLNAVLMPSALYLTRWCLTPEGSQPIEEERPHAATTLKGSQPELCVRDGSTQPTYLVPRIEH